MPDIAVGRARISSSCRGIKQLSKHSFMKSVDAKTPKADQSLRLVHQPGKHSIEAFPLFATSLLLSLVTSRYQFPSSCLPEPVSDSYTLSAKPPVLLRKDVHMHLLRRRPQFPAHQHSLDSSRYGTRMLGPRLFIFGMASPIECDLIPQKLIGAHRAPVMKVRTIPSPDMQQNPASRIWNSKMASS